MFIPFHKSNGIKLCVFATSLPKYGNSVLDPKICFYDRGLTKMLLISPKSLSDYKLKASYAQIFKKWLPSSLRIVVFLAFWNFILCHFTFTKDLHWYLFLLTKIIWSGFSLFWREQNKNKKCNANRVFSICFASSHYTGGPHLQVSESDAVNLLP